MIMKPKKTFRERGAEFEDQVYAHLEGKGLYIVKMPPGSGYDFSVGAPGRYIVPVEAKAITDGILRLKNFTPIEYRTMELMYEKRLTYIIAYPWQAGIEFVNYAAIREELRRAAKVRLKGKA